jgi:hypothetical protein
MSEGGMRQPFALDGAEELILEGEQISREVIRILRSSAMLPLGGILGAESSARQASPPVHVWSITVQLS